jgi:hypothetical protein
MKEEYDLDKVNQLLEKMPSHLFLSRNEYAPKHDTWRLYNKTTDKTLKYTGSETAYECIEKYLVQEEIDRKAWANT